MFLIVPLFQDAQLENITAAINKGDLTTLSNYLDATVEVALLEDGDIYLKKEAVNKLKTFFTKHPSISFQAVHKGFSESRGSLYCIGDLKTKEDNFRVFIYIKVQNEQYFIQELRFEKN
jgi:hypothetical protein